ncbi:MAG: methyltransferase domain-containing protein [Acidobacteriota bacterium]|nr:methyltransferase domain-containing protein [Acidobacteriota bacterium]
MLDEQPAPAVVRAVEKLAPGTALDLACGTGRHAIYLAQRGWRVMALDRSPGAIAALNKQASGLELETRVVDLEDDRFTIQPGRYDLILAWLYRQLALFPKIRDGVCPGGIAACSVLKKGRFAAKPGELNATFGGWHVLYSLENERTAEMVAKKPSDCNRHAMK